MTQCTCFVTFWSNVAIYALFRIWLKCRDLLGLSLGRNVAIYVFCQAQNVCSQAPKTILHPCSQVQPGTGDIRGATLISAAVC